MHQKKPNHVSIQKKLNSRKKTKKDKIIKKMKTKYIFLQTQIYLQDQNTSLTSFRGHKNIDHLQTILKETQLAFDLKKKITTSLFR